MADLLRCKAIATRGLQAQGFVRVEHDEAISRRFSRAEDVVTFFGLLTEVIRPWPLQGGL